MKFRGKVRYDSPSQAPSAPTHCPKCHRKLVRTGVSDRRELKHEFKSFYCEPCRLSFQVHYYDGKVVEISTSQTTVEKK
jgi:hypothetical protein